MKRALLLLPAAVLGLLGVAGPAAASTATATSTNWAGYAVARSGVTFRQVRGSWTQPAVTCGAGRRTFSANWVGIGGYHTTARALEQIGTEADCDGAGRARLSAWYELVPEASVRVPMTVRAGDRLDASVTLDGRRVTVSLVNRTRGTAFRRTLTATTVDTTSAEWIVEAPSACTAGLGCEQLPLADFGTTGFTSARAQTTAGHTGTIADPAWRAVAISLAPGGGPGLGSRRFASVTGDRAVPGELSATGTAFSVSYAASGADQPGTVQDGVMLRR